MRCRQRKHAVAFSEDEFENIYRTWAPALFNFTARLVGRQEARDLVQETFLRLFRTPVPPDRVKPWLYRVAYRLCIDHHRRKKAAPAHPVSELPEPGDPGANPETVYLAREAIARFLAAFRNLPPEGRALLLLREKDNASYREIAAITGITVEAVRSRLYRARAALHRALAIEEAK